MKITLGELYNRVCKLIEEYSGNEVTITDDEDIRLKLPIVANQGIKKILQAKPILKFCKLPLVDNEGNALIEDFANFKLYKLPDDLFQLTEVHIEAQYWTTGNGDDNYLKTKFDGEIPIEYNAFHKEIMSDSPLDTEIELTQECLQILEHYVCAGVSLDSPDTYAYFYGEYQNGLVNLSPKRSNRLAVFE